MPTIITHAMVGIAAGKAATQEKPPLRFWASTIVCGVIPDADVIGFSFGIPYGHFFGHRGFFHSPFFALLFSLLVVLLFFRKNPVFRTWRRTWLYFFLIAASHGILDAFTNGGLGIALLSPFDDGRYFFPYTPIKVSPIGLRAFLSAWGLRVMISEMLWVWTPVLGMFMAANIMRKSGLFQF